MLVGDLIKRRSAAIKWTWIRLIERRNLAQAARIHVTSEEERRTLVDLGLSLAPTVVIPNGVDAPISFSPDTVSMDVRRLVTQGFDVLSFGRISWKKGLDQLIQAAAEIPGVRVLVAGHDEEGLAAKLRKLAAECGVSDRALFLPRQITGPDKEALFASARVLALPSLSENFGNVIAEAMIRGLPVLVSDRVGAADVVEASGGGIVVRGGQQSFSAALVGILESKEQLAIMGAAGTNYAREKLTWRRTARHFEGLYEELSAAGRMGDQQRQPGAISL
jgi:glycosyltransferase involved in cell wall biosynthesis